MKCLRHDAEAAGVCAWCGRALCRLCVDPAKAGRLACNESCADALARHERGLELLVEKGAQTARANSVN